MSAKRILDLRGLTCQQTRQIRIALWKILYIITASQPYPKHLNLSAYPSIPSLRSACKRQHRAVLERDYSDFKTAEGAQPCGYHLGRPKAFPMRYFEMNSATYVQPCNLKPTQPPGGPHQCACLRGNQLWITIAALDGCRAITKHRRKKKTSFVLPTYAIARRFAGGSLPCKRPYPGRNP